MFKTAAGQIFSMEEFEKTFPIIDIGKLNGHKFLQYEPKNGEQRKPFDLIRKGIELKLPPFRSPIMDPSLEKERVVFKPGLKPAVGKSARWWKETWEEFLPAKNSRCATELHWAAILGILMVYLVDNGYSVAEAWEAVCNDSRNLGHYWNSADAEHHLEPTGSRKVGERYDFANTCKVLEAWDGSGFLLASGYYGNNSKACPLADIVIYTLPCDFYLNCVGLLVMDV